jgi:hypothetical protein
MRAPLQRAALRLVHGASEEWSWFCGHCAAPSPGGQAPAPGARVCRSCGFGLLLEARRDAIPTADDPFLIVDRALLIQGVSRKAELLFAIDEGFAVNRAITEVLVPAEAQAGARMEFAAALTEAVAGDGDPVYRFVRPWNTYGVRLRVRIAACGPPRAALLVIEQ